MYLVYVESIPDKRENDERDSRTETSFETYISTIYFTLETVINERGDELVSVLDAHFVALAVTQLQFKLIYRRFISN